MSKFLPDFLFLGGYLLHAPSSHTTATKRTTKILVRVLSKNHKVPWVYRNNIPLNVRAALPHPLLPQAVNEEWIKGGHRRRAVRVLALFLVYMGIFTLSAVLNSGRNTPHGFHLTTYDIENCSSVVTAPVPVHVKAVGWTYTTRIFVPVSTPHWGSLLPRPFSR